MLSFAKQRALEICITISGGADVVLPDKPTEGLSPQMTTRVGDLLEEISRRGVSILLFEQKLSIALKLSHQVCVVGHGQVVFKGTSADLAEREDLRKEWLEV